MGQELLSNLNNSVMIDDSFTEYRYSDSKDNAMSSSSDNSFIISFEKLNMDKPIKKLGEGGMGTVFQTKWNGMVIAVKVFDLNDITSQKGTFM